MRPPQLYAIYEDLHEATDAGVGIPRRRPRLTAQQCALVRHQLEHGACYAAFMAGINGTADPGLRPFEPKIGTAEPWVEAEKWAADVERRKRGKQVARQVGSR